MTELKYFIISLAVFAAFLLLILGLFVVEKLKGVKINTSKYVLFVLGLFLAMFIAFWPVFRIRIVSADRFYAALGIFQSTLRLFLADFNVEELAMLDLAEHRIYCVILAILAPLTTFATILSLFKGIIAHVRLWLVRNLRCIGFCSVYVFNELNGYTISIAESIHKNKTLFGRLFLRFVFTDVFSQNKETDYELVKRVQQIGGLLFKESILQIDRTLRRGLLPRLMEGTRLEYFLFGENETENVAHTIEIKKANFSSKVKLLLWVQTAADMDAELLESMNSLIEEETPDCRKFNALWNRYIEPDKELLYRFDNASVEVIRGLKACIDHNQQILIRRVNPHRYMAWECMSQTGNFIDCKKKKISVLIVGMGRLGPELFKAALWMYYRYGYRLEINVVDAHADLRSRLESMCPALAEQDEALLSELRIKIRCFSGVDVFTHKLQELFEENPCLWETTVAFCCLGSDELNVEASLTLRKIFENRNVDCFVEESPERICNASGRNALADEIVSANSMMIYPIVFDHVRSEIFDSLQATVMEKEGNPRKKYAFNRIGFLGNLAEMYRYDLLSNEKLSLDGFRYHCLYIGGKSVFKSAQEYNLVEYNRLSSDASALYARFFKKNPTPYTEYSIQEHGRWLAYMIAYGHRYCAQRYDVALRHHLMIPYDQLEPEEKKKDDAPAGILKILMAEEE